MMRALRIVPEFLVVYMPIITMKLMFQMCNLQMALVFHLLVVFCLSNWREHISLTELNYMQFHAVGSLSHSHALHIFHPFDNQHLRKQIVDVARSFTQILIKLPFSFLFELNSSERKSLLKRNKRLILNIRNCIWRWWIIIMVSCCRSVWAYRKCVFVEDTDKNVIYS